MRIHFDLVGGAAGDMIVAALLDAFPQHQGAVVFAIARAAPDVDLAIVRHNDGVLQGRRFKATLDGHAAEQEHQQHHHDHGHDHHHGHDHDDHHHHHDHDAHHDGHRAWREIRRHLTSCGLEEAVARHAIGIFAELAAAEGKVHGIAADDVTFHEVGAWDSVADIVGAAALIAAIGAEAWTVGAIPLGSGRVKTAHGLLPVPAPATALLMQGFETLDDGVGGERVTPTGMAVLRYLCKGQGARSGVLKGSGVGFGTRKLPGMSNCLRVLVFDEATTAPVDQVEVVEFEIDDQSPEDLTAALDHLRGLDGVLDVLQAPAFGKKGRVVTMVRLLADTDGLEAVIAAVFEHTATIGLRHHRVARAVLPRRVQTVWVDGRAVSVKVVERPGGATAKAEADDLPVAGRADVKRRAEAAALKGSS